MATGRREEKQSSRRQEQPYTKYILCRYDFCKTPWLFDRQSTRPEPKHCTTYLSGLPVTESQDSPPYLPKRDSSPPDPLPSFCSS